MIRARSVLTERARAECARRVGQDATDVARVAVDLGVGWGTVMRAVWEYGQRVLDAQWLHTNVTVLGLDETAFLAASVTSPTQFVTGLVDLEPAGGGPAAAARCRGRPLGHGGHRLAHRPWTRLVHPGEGRRPRPLPGATSGHCTPGCPTRVVDAFHAVRLAQGAIDDVRRRVQQDTLGHRGRRGDPLYGIRRVLLRGAENRTERSYARLLAGLDAGRTEPQPSPQPREGRRPARRRRPACGRSSSRARSAAILDSRERREYTGHHDHRCRHELGEGDLPGQRP